MSIVNFSCFTFALVLSDTQQRWQNSCWQDIQAVEWFTEGSIYRCWLLWHYVPHGSWRANEGCNAWSLFSHCKFSSFNFEFVLITCRRKHLRKVELWTFLGKFLNSCPSFSALSLIISLSLITSLGFIVSLLWLWGLPAKAR